MLPSLYALPIYDFDLRVSHARTLLPAALASVPFGFVLVRVRVRSTRHFSGLFLAPAGHRLIDFLSRRAPADLSIACPLSC